MYKIATLNKISPVGLSELTDRYQIIEETEKADGIVVRSQNMKEMDERKQQTAKILSEVRYFYFIDKYGLQWEFEQGHTDIGD